MAKWIVLLTVSWAVLTGCIVNYARFGWTTPPMPLWEGYLTLMIILPAMVGVAVGIIGIVGKKL